MIDAVLSFHLNPYTCGVAKFNGRLSRELGVPLGGLTSAGGRYLQATVEATYPLLSIKFAELVAARFFLRPFPRYALFIHDAPRSEEHVDLVTRATQVYAANPVIAREIRAYRPDVREAWCPSLIEPPRPRAELTVLTFGMAHKYVDNGDVRFGLPMATRDYPTRRHFEKLRDLLDATGAPYTILLSTAVHEGTPWDEALEESAATMRRIFGDERVEALGFLSDAALWREMQQASAVAMFFEPALRANNTTFWAAVDARCRIITNIDADSPIAKGPVQIEDIHAMREWTHYPFTQWSEGYPNSSWDGLKSLMQGQPCAK